MIYIFDNSPLSVLFKNYYRDRFPSLWTRFDQIVSDERLLSTREVLKEIEDSRIRALRDWAKDHKTIFTTPTAEEGHFVARIYKVQHFQHNIERKKLLNGGKVADPFVVAKAAVMNGTVVTTEEHRPHAARIPNICEHFEVPCVSLEIFMELEDWKF